jgi:hypothetical protein
LEEIMWKPFTRNHIFQCFPNLQGRRICLLNMSSDWQSSKCISLHGLWEILKWLKNFLMMNFIFCQNECDLYIILKCS